MLNIESIKGLGIESFRIVVNKIVHDEAIPYREIADNTGLHEDSIRKFLTGKRNASMEFANKILLYLNKRYAAKNKFTKENFNVELLRNALTKFIKDNNLSYTQVSAGSGVSSPTISDFVNGKCDILKSTGNKLSYFIDNYSEFNSNILSYDKIMVLTLDKYNLAKFIQWTKFKMVMLDLTQADLIKGCGYENLTLVQLWSTMKKETEGFSIKKASMIFNFIKYYSMNKTKNNNKIDVINKYRYNQLSRLLGK